MYTGIEKKIKELVISELNLDMVTDDIGDEDYLLIGGIGIDSIAIIEILVKLEEEFNIFFEDYELTKENMVNVKAISDLVCQKMEKK